MDTFYQRWVDQTRALRPSDDYEEDPERRLWVPRKRLFFMPPEKRLFKPANHEGLVTITMDDMNAIELALGGFVTEDPVTGARMRGRVNFAQIGQLTDLEIAIVLQQGRQMKAEEPAKRAQRVIDASLSVVERRGRIVETGREGGDPFRALERYRKERW